MKVVSADESFNFSQFAGLQIDGIAACVPKKRVTNSDLESVFGQKNMRRFGTSTGILERRVVADETALDLCIAAARELKRNGSDLEKIGAVIFVSQTPDYVLPASAIIAQDRLGIPRGTPAFDVGLGCSGYVYGLWLAASLITSGATRSILLLAGDTISKTTDSDDRSTRPIFGDAGSATIISASVSTDTWSFSMGSDGAGFDSIIVPNSASRQEVLSNYNLGKNAINEKLYMDGQAVFNFTSEVIPELIKSLMLRVQWSPDDLDGLYLHQANKLILKTIGRKSEIIGEKISCNLDRFGNTSSASIPLALVASPMVVGPHNALMCGFGVGLSWGAMAARIGEFPKILIEGIEK